MNINLTLLSQAVAFGIFVWFTARFVWPPLLRAIETRQKQIADGLAAAERGRHDLELAAKRTEEMLTETRQRTQEILTQADKRAGEIVEEAKVQAKAEANRIVAGAKAEIEQELFRARETLRTQVASLAVKGAEKILQREVDAKAHGDILERLAAQL
jgi:F-type H+-transporting ATPase subunit b